MRRPQKRDAHGNPLEFVVTEGQVQDIKEASTLADKTNADFLLGDKGYDCDALRKQLVEKQTVPIIPMKENSKRPNPYFDKEIYKAPHVIENLFAKMKQFRGFATRYDKLKRNYEAAVAIICTKIWLDLLVI